MTLYRFFAVLLYPLFKLIYNFRIVGKENIEDGEHYVVCANHTAYRDPVLLVYMTKKEIRFVAKSDLQRIVPMRLVFKIFKPIAIRRGESDRQALKYCCEALKSGENIGIFPQGTRTAGIEPDSHQAKAGISLIASSTRSAVLPVRIKYKNNKPHMFSKTYVIIGKPVYYEEYSSIMNGEATRLETAQYLFGKVCELDV